MLCGRRCGLMRLEFLTQDDPLYVLPFFDEFVRNYSAEFKISNIASSRPMGKRARKQMLKELAQLYGPLGFARLMTHICRSRFFGMLPRKTRAGSFLTLSQLCRAYRIPHVRIGNPNEPEFVESVRSRAPDLLISVACPYILKEPLLTIAPKGAINIHHAPLPKYKGMMPTFWQMYYGEKTVGLTIHHMEASVDEGAALLQATQVIKAGESLHHLIQRSKRYGAHCMAQALRGIRDGNASPVTLDHSKGTYFSFPTASDIREFHRRGLHAI